MKWYYWLLAGFGLVGVGLFIRKKQVDSAANARSFRGAAKNVTVNEEDITETSI